MKASALFKLLQENQVQPDEELYFATDEEVNSLYKDAELIQMVGDKGKYLTFVPVSDTIDPLEL